MKLLDTLAVVIGPRRLPLRVLESLFDSGAAAIRIGGAPPRRWTRSSSALRTASAPPGSAVPMSSGPVPGYSRRPAAAWGCLEKTSAPSSSPPDCSSPQTARVQAVREKVRRRLCRDCSLGAGCGSAGRLPGWTAAAIRPPRSSPRRRHSPEQSRSPRCSWRPPVRSTVRWPWSSWLPEWVPRSIEAPCRRHWTAASRCRNTPALRKATGRCSPTWGWPAGCLATI